MYDLFASEWRRFRRLALVFFLGHVLVLFSLSRITNPLMLGYEEHALMLAIYMLVGLGLALLQVGSYRKPSQWLWLIHRPLPPARIFLALALSALTLLGGVVLLPLLGFLLASEAFTTHVVDSRQYVALVHVLAFTMMAWLAGVHAQTSRHKAAIAVLLVPLVLALQLASVWWLLLPVLASFAWLAWITLHGFRADRAAAIVRPGVLLMTALPLQFAFFLLLFHASKLGLEAAEVLGRGQSGKTVLSTDAGIEDFMRNMSRNAVIKGLEGSRDARAASWRQQLPLLEVAELVPDIERFPVRDQLSNIAVRWTDDERGIEWTFSHDRMMFHGRDPRTGADRGWWGTGGAGSREAFAQVPIHNVTRDVLYAIDDRTQKQYEQLRLPAGEWFTARPTPALDRLFVLTNRRLLALKADRAALALFAPPRLDWQIELPEGAEHLAGVNIAELMDGWLVSTFYYPGQEFDGFEDLVQAWQQVLHVSDRGAVAVVGERRNIRDHHVVFGGSPAVPLASWWLSPVLYTLARWPEQAFDRGLTHPPAKRLLPDVPLFYPLAAALMLLSLGLGAWWLRGARTSAARRRLWLAACATLGLPALLSLLCLEPRAPRP